MCYESRGLYLGLCLGIYQLSLDALSAVDLLSFTTKLGQCVFITADCSWFVAVSLVEVFAAGMLRQQL